MRLLYIVPKIKIAGGVARALSIKANYFTTHFGYEVHILSQNEKHILPFYDFNPKIVFHNMILEGNVWSFFKSFQEQVNQSVKSIQPDVILVADNGLKAFLIPFISKTKTPIVLELHSSKFIEEKILQTNPFSKFIRTLKYQFKYFGAQKFTKTVALSPENVKEWKVKNALVIPNPSWINTEIVSDVKKKKVLAVARNSYEKGLDRLLLIWREIEKKHPDWTLDIYTDNALLLEKTALTLGIKSGIHYFGFVKNIEEKYLESSVYIMTSRYEGFPMVLLEAMSCGLPCIAYDCPTGPRSIIIDAENGFLIPENNIEMFVEKLSFLIENETVRSQLGQNAWENSKNYSVEKIMMKWKEFLEQEIEKKSI